MAYSTGYPGSSHLPTTAGAAGITGKSKERGKAMGPGVSVRDLHFRYPASGEDTIKGITFDVHEGEIFGLLGPSGAGKSTTQKILVKLLDRYRGSVRYFGRDLREIDNSYYEEIGVGFEMPVHFTKLTAATV